MTSSEIKQPLGYLGDLSEEQQEILYQFKEWAHQNAYDSNPWFTNSFYLRFCRARQFDIESIKSMFEKYMQYREDNQIDNIITDFKMEQKPLVHQYFPKGHYGVDKQGRPILIERSSYYQIDKMFEIISDEEFWLDWCQDYERQQKLYYMASSFMHQRQVFHNFNITDLNNFSLKMMSSKAYGLLQKHLQMSQAYYPESLGKMMIVNAPWTFSTVWAVVKGWVDEKTRSKIQILSGNPLPELLKYIDIEQIPDFLGGQNQALVTEDHGPWDDFELIDGSNPGDIVGIRKKSDGPNGPIFTPQDFEALPNYLLDNPHATASLNSQQSLPDGVNSSQQNISSSMVKFDLDNNQTRQKNMTAAYKFSQPNTESDLVDNSNCDISIACNIPKKGRKSHATLNNQNDEILPVIRNMKHVKATKTPKQSDAELKSRRYGPQQREDQGHESTAQNKKMKLQGSMKANNDKLRSLHTTDSAYQNKFGLDKKMANPWAQQQDTPIMDSIEQFDTVENKQSSEDIDDDFIEFTLQINRSLFSWLLWTLFIFGVLGAIIYLIIIRLLVVDTDNQLREALDTLVKLGYQAFIGQIVDSQQI